MCESWFPGAAREFAKFTKPETNILPRYGIIIINISLYTTGMSILNVSTNHMDKP